MTRTFLWIAIFTASLFPSLFLWHNRPQIQDCIIPAPIVKGLEITYSNRENYGDRQRENMKHQIVDLMQDYTIEEVEACF